MSDNIKELIKILLKNNLITIKEIAMLKANRKEDRDELIALVQRLYENREVKYGDVAVILVDEDNILELIDYITSEPISIPTIETHDKEITTVPPNYIPLVIPNMQNTIPYPYRPDIVFCAQNSNNTTIA